MKYLMIFLFSFYCRGSAVLCRSLASVCQQVKQVHTINLFDNFLDLSFASGLKAVPESKKKTLSGEQFYLRGLMTVCMRGGQGTRVGI